MSKIKGLAKITAGFTAHLGDCFIEGVIGAGALAMVAVLDMPKAAKIACTALIYAGVANRVARMESDCSLSTALVEDGLDDWDNG